MRTTYLILFTLFAPFTLLNAQIRGNVVDGGNQLPLSDVHIYLQKDSAGIDITDGEGNYQIPYNRVNASDTLVFSRVGYHPFKATMSMLKAMGGKVLMYEQAQMLAEVSVAGERHSEFLECVELQSMPQALFAFGGFQKGDKIYVAGGDETSVEKTNKKDEEENSLFYGVRAQEFRSPHMYVYDISTDSWTTLPVKLVPRAGHAAHCYRDKVFIIGGLRYSTNRRLQFTDATMEVYDMDKDTLYVDPVNPHQGTGFASFVHDDCLYVIGGAVKERKFTDKIHTLDLKNGVWYELADRIPAEYTGKRNGILVGHKVYFFGGWRGAPQWTSVSYDLQSGTWEPLCDLKAGAAFPGLATDGKQIYIYEAGVLQVYDLSRNTIRSYRVASEAVDAGLFYADGKLYIVGGCERDGEELVTPSSAVCSIDVSWMQ